MQKQQCRTVKRKTMILGIVFAVCFAVLPCAQTAQAQEQTDNTNALTMMTIQGSDYSKLLEGLREKYPEINVELSSYKGANTTAYCEVVLEADDIPDVFVMTYPPSEELQQERLIDLSGETFTSAYSEKLLSDLSVDGSLYLVPTNISLMGIYYNKTLFEKQGWEVPNSLEEVEALIPEIEAAGVTVSECATKFTGVTFSYFFSASAPSFMASLEGIQWRKDFLNGEAAATGNLEGAVETFQRWVDDGIFNIGETPDDDDDTLTRFKEGNTAFLVTNSALGFTQNEDGTGDEYGLLPYFSVDGSNNIIITNAARYVGISKRLENQPEKLENALKIMTFIASPEGQECLDVRANSISPLKNDALAEDSPLSEIAKLVDEGKSMEIVYSGWEDYVVDFGGDVKELIAGDLSGEEFLAKIDELQKTVLENEEELQLAEVEEDLDKEQAAQLVGAAFAEAVDADCALISIGDYHGVGQENANGVNANIYAGILLSENVVSTFNPLGWSNTIKTLTLPGKTIKEWEEEGYFVDGDETPFTYVLVTKDGAEFDDTADYTVALVTESEERAAEGGGLADSGVVGQEALTAYIEELGSISSESIIWK